MRLHVLSDLHLERAPFDDPLPDCDVVVLAGDIAVGTHGVEWARDWVRGRPVLYLAGNHEFYGHALPDLLDEIRGAAEGSSVHVLDDDEVLIGGVRFLGCTLWSDFDFDGAENRERSMLLCSRVVNDFKQITLGQTGRRFSPDDARALHLSSRRWLTEQLERPHHGPTVVLTHHGPLIRGRPDSTVLRAVAGAFASDVSELMGEDRVALWIYGHTHRAADVDVRGTRVVSNPRGYPEESVAGFYPGYVIEVP